MINKDYEYNFDGNYNYNRYVKLTVWNKDYSDMYTNDYVLIASKAHSKYYKHIKHLCTSGNEYIIDGELYRVSNGIHQLTGCKQLALIQHMKTKDKVLRVGNYNISSMLQSFIIHNNMLKTGIKADRTPLRHLRRVDGGDYYYPTIERTNGTLSYSWYNGEIQDYQATYGMSKTDLRQLVHDYYLYIDKDYNIVYRLPTGYNNDIDLDEVNKLLKDVFGGVLEVKEIEIPSLKESGIC